MSKGQFEVTRDGRRLTAYAAVEGARTWVFIDGQTFVIEAAASTRRRAATDEAAVAAPMPATVVQVNVKAGQTVATGDVLVTLEAMKMELPIKAPCDGVVAAVNCRLGELVQPGVPLVELQ